MSDITHPFTLRQLQYVVAVADALSFRRAAERCRVAQPSLSAQLAQVEQALGVTLFERDRRRVLVTPAGADFVERARRLLVEAEALADAARRFADPLAGTLRLGVIPTVAPYLVPAAAGALRAAFPRLFVAWTEERTATLVRALAAGALDGALLALEADLGDVEHAVIAFDPFLLAAPPAHPLARRRGAATPHDLHDVPVLLLDDGHCLREQALAACGSSGAREREFRATSLATLAQMVAAGAGVTLLPGLAAAAEGERAGLALRRFAEPAPGRTIALAWRRHAALAGALRAIAAEIRRGYPGGAPPRGSNHPVSPRSLTRPRGR